MVDRVVGAEKRPDFQVNYRRVDAWSGPATTEGEGTAHLHDAYRRVSK
jgi:hypothetical protein